MKRYYTGDTLRIPYSDGKGFLEGMLTGIYRDGEKIGIEVNEEFFPISRFEGVKPQITKYDLSVFVRNGAKVISHKDAQ